ncbi:hypothetical protein BCR35DRAFT_350928 [Leucosporidium creatinivorum]|uniref:Uncharacterized protein n=1 Tax=Leucosporidium creatinivorum TaxID=106004 RepID=A0A1Y2G0H4_9BASI|nr:hypothetical protein BCR35DRAFT_350928 [Leucosporidium creatinivorum]
MQERGDETSKELQQEGQSGREGETSSSDGAEFVETSEGLVEDPSTPAPLLRSLSAASALQPTSAAFQPCSFIFPEPATTSSPPTTNISREPISGLWTPAKSGEVRIARIGSAGEEVKETLRESVRRRSLSSEMELAGAEEGKVTATPLSSSLSSPVWERAKSAAPVKLQKSDGSPVIEQPPQLRSVPDSVPAPSQSTKVSIRSPTAFPLQAFAEAAAPSGAETSTASSSHIEAPTTPIPSTPAAPNLDTADVGSASTDRLGAKVSDLATASQAELEELIKMASSTRKLMETSPSTSPVLPSSPAPASPTRSSPKTLDAPSLPTPSPRRPSAATFLPVEIPPFQPRRPKSPSPREKEKEKKDVRALKPSASEYVPKKETAPRFTITTATPKKEEEASKAVSKEASKKDSLPSVKKKLTVPEGSVVYAEKTPNWCPPGTPGYDDYVASLTSASHIRRPSTANGSAATSFSSNPAVSYLPPHSLNPYAPPLSTSPTDFRAYPLPWSSPPPAPQAPATLSPQQAYQQAFPHLGAQPAPRPPPALQPPPNDRMANSNYMAAVERQVASYASEVYKAKEEVRTKEAQLRSLHESTKALKYECEEVKGRLVELRKAAEERDKWEERARSSKDKERLTASERDELSQSLEAVREELSRRLEELEAKLREVEVERDYFKFRYEEAVTEIAHLDDAAEAALQSSPRALSPDPDTISRLEKELCDSQDQNTRLESKLADLNKTLEATIVKHEHEKTAFQQQSQAAIEHLKRNRDELAHQFNEVVSDSKIRELKHKETKEAAAELLDNKSEASALLDDLIASVAPLEVDKKDLEAKNKELSELLDGLMKDVERLESEKLKAANSPPSCAPTPRAASPTRSVSASVPSTAPESSTSTESNGPVLPVLSNDRARAFTEKLARGRAELGTQQDLQKSRVRRYGNTSQEKDASPSWFSGPLSTR